ncbi:MAG: hypothetical protein KC416_13700, partial [Myxococcales bacterium]|nr:hypothetical protein [Myxococcales bacterium]
YRAAEMAFKRKNWNEAKKEMKNFIRDYEKDKGASELIVQAYWRIAESTTRTNKRDYLNALRDVVSAYKRVGAKSGSIAAEYAAEADFILVDQTIADFEKYEVNPGKPKTMKDYVDALKKQIDSGAKEAQSLVKGYEPIPSYGRPAWTVAALVRQGRVYEVLARAILNAKFVMPADLQKQLKRMDEFQREDIRFEVEGAVQQVLDQRVRPVECFAVARYALAARAAQAGSLDTEFTQIAVDRLQAYGDERIGECIAEAQKNDPNFASYRPGEFTRAPRGKLMSMPADVAPPPLATQGGGR